MRGAPTVAIQRLAGHRDIATTTGYMHLAPSELTRAIGLLDTPVDADSRQHSGNSFAA